MAKRGLDSFKKINEQFMAGIVPLTVVGGPVGGHPRDPVHEQSWVPKLHELIGYTEGHLPAQLHATAARMDPTSARTFITLLQALADQQENLQVLIDTLGMMDRIVRDCDATIEGGEVRQLLTLTRDMSEFLRTIAEGAARI